MTNGVSEFTKSGREGDSRFEAVGIGKSSIEYPVTNVCWGKHDI